MNEKDWIIIGKVLLAIFVVYAVATEGVNIYYDYYSTGAKPKAERKKSDFTVGDDIYYSRDSTAPVFSVDKLPPNEYNAYWFATPSRGVALVLTTGKNKGVIHFVSLLFPDGSAVTYPVEELAKKARKP